MKEHGMIFNGEMVRALLDGRKTQTRRPVKIDLANAFDPPRCEQDVKDGYPWVEDAYGDWHRGIEFSPYGQPGDRIWCRETWCQKWEDAEGYVEKALYRADGLEVFHPDSMDKSPWRPSIHMPRWAARILLEITEVRVQRLREISEADALAEGLCNGDQFETATDEFRSLWDSIYAAKGLGWTANPWVWAYTFKRVPS